MFLLLDLRKVTYSASPFNNLYYAHAVLRVVTRGALGTLRKGRVPREKLLESYPVLRSHITASGRGGCRGRFANVVSEAVLAGVRGPLDHDDVMTRSSGCQRHLVDGRQAV